jgi:hypothetical protein
MGTVQIKNMLEDLRLTGMIKFRRDQGVVDG